ncbi:InlB B-repeat-containing protein [Desulfoluna sp.]|uniref:InlB B-repeat-containing protein n=1 Tax=Desulfoluna sp. TaxID=2045199 RepID=UPI002612189A|nr:InlB B-repeat-containing protein [Desulfoluna sp.]
MNKILHFILLFLLFFIIVSTAQARVGIVVNKDLYPLIKDSLSTYISDLRTIEGKEVWLSSDRFDDSDTIADLKAMLQDNYQNNELEGVVLIGDLPIAWMELDNDWEEYASFPSDLYYMDMDGTWEDKASWGKSGIFDTFPVNLYPEIWISRITAGMTPMLGDEEVIVKDYFDRVHDRMKGMDTISHRYLVLGDTDCWGNSLDGFDGFVRSSEMGYANGEVTKYLRYNGEDTRENWIKGMRDGYEYALVTEHSAPNLHCTKWDSPKDFFYNVDYQKMAADGEPGNVRFYNLFACSNARFTYKDFLAGSYAWGHNGLVSIGSTKTGSMLYFGEYNEPLGEGKSFGEAFLAWVRRVGVHDLSWHGGMTLMGVGSLKLLPYAKDDFSVTVTATAEGKASLSETISVVEDTDGSPIEIKASAKVVTGTVSRVEFFRNDLLIGEDSNFPYSISWANPDKGIHLLKAVAYNSAGDKTISSPVKIIVAGKLGEGSISMQYWNDETAVDDFTDFSTYPDNSTYSSLTQLQDFQTSPYSRAYCTRITGFIHPPVTGNYNFYMAGCNTWKLRLSSDEAEANKSLLLSVSAYGEFPEEASKSAPVSLESGKKYFIEALHKGEERWSSLTVGWSIPGLEVDVIQGLFLSPEYVFYKVDFNCFNYHGDIKGGLNQCVKPGDNTWPITAVPAQGYCFTGWRGDYTGSDNPLTLHNVNSNMIIEAGFAVKTYKVNFISGEHGHLNGVTEQVVPYGGSSSAVKPEADEGYQFTGWSGAYTGTEKTLRVDNVISDKTITAEFAVMTYKVGFIAGEHGRIEGVTEQVIRHGGSSSAVEPEADEGYQFTGWTGSYTGTDKTLRVDNVISDKTITAKFAVKTYNVDFIAGEHGRLKGVTEQVIPHGGSSSAVEPEADEGYQFTGWTGNYQGTDENLIIENITTDLTIASHFALKPEDSGQNGCFISTVK